MNTTLAIATADGVNVSPHLARATLFSVLTIADGCVEARADRARETDQCGNHRTFVEMLDGCRAVICGGIGQGAVNALEAHGIKPLVVAGAMTMEEALARYLAGDLPTTDARVCLCGDGH